MALLGLAGDARSSARRGGRREGGRYAGCALPAVQVVCGGHKEIKHKIELQLICQLGLTFRRASATSY
jgi:hypothetical protein